MDTTYKTKDGTIAPSFKGVKRPTIFKTEQNARVLDLKAQGCSNNEIARMLNLTPQRISKIYNNYKNKYVRQED